MKKILFLVGMISIFLIGLFSLFVYDRSRPDYFLCPVKLADYETPTSTRHIIAFSTDWNDCVHSDFAVGFTKVRIIK